MFKKLLIIMIFLICCFSGESFSSEPYVVFMLPCKIQYHYYQLNLANDEVAAFVDDTMALFPDTDIFYLRMALSEEFDRQLYEMETFPASQIAQERAFNRMIINCTEWRNSPYEDITQQKVFLFPRPWIFFQIIK